MKEKPDWSKVINQLARYFNLETDERGLEYLDNQLTIIWLEGKRVGYEIACKEWKSSVDNILKK